MKTIKSLLTLLLVVCLLLTGCQSQESVDIKSEYLDTAALSEDSYKTTQAYLGDFSIDFSIDTRMSFLGGREIYWEYSGDHFGELKVENNQAVKKGDVLMTVEVGVSEADVLMRELAVSEATAALAQVDTSYGNQINQKSASMTGLSGDELSIAEYELMALQNDYYGRRQAALYRLSQATKALEELTEHQEKTQVTAPYDGVIVYITRAFRTGDEIPTNSPILGIAALSSQAVILENLNKSYNIPYLQTVTLTDMRDQKQYTGTVVTSADVSDDESDTVVILPDIPEGSDALAGAVRVTGKLLSVTNVVLIDSRAVRQEGTKRYVLVLQNKSVSKVYVSVGGSNVTTTWITEGLQGGETVVLP